MIHKQLLLSLRVRRNIKKCEYHENIGPLYGWKTADYLMHNSDLYKNLVIKLDTKWLNHVVNKESDIENMSSIVNEHYVFPSTSKDNYSNASEINTEEVVHDEIDEDDETCAAVDRGTMFDNADPYPKGLIFAPGEERNMLVYSQTKALNIWLFQQFYVVRDVKEEMLLFIIVNSVNMN